MRARARERAQQCRSRRRAWSSGPRRWLLPRPGCAPHPAKPWRPIPAPAPRWRCSTPSSVDDRLQRALFVASRTCTRLRVQVLSQNASTCDRKRGAVTASWQMPERERLPPLGATRRPWFGRQTAGTSAVGAGDGSASRRKRRGRKRKRNLHCAHWAWALRTEACMPESGVSQLLLAKRRGGELIRLHAADGRDSGPRKAVEGPEPGRQKSSQQTATAIGSCGVPRNRGPAPPPGQAH